MTDLEKERNKYNNLILDVFRKYLNEHPGIRFGQALFNLGVIYPTTNGTPTETCKIHDPHSDEPKEIYERINKLLNR